MSQGTPSAPDAAAAVADRHRLASAVHSWRLRRAQFSCAQSDARVAAHWHRRRCLAAALARWSQSRSPAAVWRRNPYATGWALATHGSEASEARHARRAELAQCACELLLLRRHWAAEATRDALARWRIRIGADDPRTSRALAWAAARRRLRRCGAALRRWATEVRWRAMLRDISTRCADCARAERKFRRLRGAVRTLEAHAARRQRVAAAAMRADLKALEAALFAWRRRSARFVAARARWRRAAAALRARLRQEVGARLRQLGALRAAGEAQRRDSDARWRAAYSAFAGELRSPALRSPALRTPTCRS